MESKIIGYRGIANSERIIISGHAFEKHKVRIIDSAHGKRKNLKQTIRRFQAQPLKMTAIDVTINGETKRVRTNSKGFFTCEVTHLHNEPGWYPYELYWKRNDKRFESEYYVSDDHETGVVSDIDDTVLVSHSTRMIRKMALQLFKNAHTRKTIPFLHNWHGYLKDLNDENHPRDFFYVSNSEWNLYDFLLDFFAINELPKGVFFLQNLKRGVKDFIYSGKSHKSHKLNSIEFLMRFYPLKKFILVGDNSQKDMEIYHKIVAGFHGRVKGVMIRKLPYIKNDAVIQTYKEKINHCDVPFLTFS